MPEDAFEPIRLQKYLARSGCGGRRRCEEFILEGRVCVNGVVVTELGTKVDPHSDEVMLDGCPVLMQDELVVLALNKPVGIYSTMREQAGRECVADLLPMRQYPSPLLTAAVGTASIRVYIRMLSAAQTGSRPQSPAPAWPMNSSAGPSGS